MRTTKELAPTTEAAIFARLWDGEVVKLNITVARHLLRLRFSDDEQARVVSLVRRNRDGELTPAEIEEMDNYLKVADLLALLQSKARLFLRRHKAQTNGNR